MKDKLDRWDWLFASIASTIALGPWAPFVRAGVRASIAAVHRPHGDSQYLPMVAALAKLDFGDHQVWEARGSGLCSFPSAALLPHAAGLRLLGAPGLMLVDAAVGAAYFLAGRWLLMEIGLGRRWASWLSLASLLLCFGGALAPLYDMGIPLGLFPTASVVWPLSAFRFPRPYVTELFVLLAVASLLRLASPRRLRVGGALAGAASAAALLQADIYAATAVLPVLLVAAVARHSFDAVRTRAGRRHAAAFAIALSALVVPFVLQRMLEHPDVPWRFGVRPAELEELTELERWRAGWTLAVVAALLAPLSFRRLRRSAAARSALVALACLFLLTACASLARAAFVIATGKVVQPYHFDLLHPRLLGIALLAAVGLVGQLSISVLGRRARVAVAFAGVVILAGVSWRHLEEAWRTPLPTYHARSDFFHYRELGPTYLRDLRVLASQLRRRAREGVRVIATLDHELAVWWVTFMNGAVLNPDPFATPLSNDEIERRLVALGRLLGLSQHEFLDLLLQGADPDKNNRLGHNNIVTNLLFSHARYTVGHSWYLYIPPAERRRLMQLYSESEARDYRVDGIVLFARGSLAHLEPDPERFELAYANRTFRLYLPR